MKGLLASLVLFAAIAAYAPIAMAQTTPPKGPSDAAPGETSDRTPEKKTETPLSQKQQTEKGETSDRTPQRHGEREAPPPKDPADTMK